MDPNRNMRKEVLELMHRDLILPGALARECGVSEDAILEWLDGGRKARSS
jgi:hypothetical protein